MFVTGCGASNRDGNYSKFSVFFVLFGVNFTAQ
jgi:hypothetical protein